jgi:hypothetical protein
VVPGPHADHGTHRRVEPESLGVVEVLVPGQAAEDRLPQQGGRGVLSIPAGSTALQLTGGGSGQIEGDVVFAVGQESGIAGDLGAEESEPESAVELGSQWFGRAVTPKVGSTNGQEATGNPGSRRVSAQLSCRLRLLNWEIRAPQLARRSSRVQ